MIEDGAGNHASIFVFDRFTSPTFLCLLMRKFCVRLTICVRHKQHKMNGVLGTKL